MIQSRRAEIASVNLGGSTRDQIDFGAAIVGKRRCAGNPMTEIDERAKLALVVEAANTIRR